MGYERELDAMRRWVDETDPIAMQHLALHVETETKPDGTPVTVADKAIERALRGFIEETFPGDSVFGEEGGASGSGARRWIVDPIDGTKNYARGIPVFATLIALEDGGDLVAGFVSAPALGARWWGARDIGAFKDGARIHVSSVGRVEDADVCTGGIDWDEQGSMRAVEHRARRTRGFGDFWGYCLVAQGSMDVMIEFAPLAEYDIAAPRVIVEQAGGTITSIDGARDPRGGAVLATNGLLHDEVLELLRED